MEMTETNNSLIKALESNKEDTALITRLFGGLREDYNNLILMKESLELQIENKRKVVIAGYTVAGGITLMGIGMWGLGGVIDNRHLKNIGIGMTFGGGIPLLAISITDIVTGLKR